MSDRPTSLEIARDLLQRGWMPLPVPYREKNPGAGGWHGWQDFTVTEAELPQHFNSERQNIGVLLGDKSGGRVDVDLDCHEAVRLAPSFLPQTEAIFGRKSKRRSHWEYIAPGAKTQRFLDVDGKTTLLELRSTGAQTIFPGSAHKETGELIEWDVNGVPARLETLLLQSCVRTLAAACLLARHWPSPAAPGEHGARHHASLALAGGLIRSGWTETRTRHFLESVCLAAKDEETHSRLQNVASTVHRQATGENTTGWPTLAECVGEKVVQRVRGWLGISTDPHYEARHAGTNNQTVSSTKPDESPLQIVRMADIATELVRWLWYPYIAFGKLTILEGDPGLGKSWLTCAIAAAVSCGRGLPGTEPFEPGNVLMLSAEDGLADTLRPRLDAVGADVSRVFALAEPITFDTPGLIRLEAAIIEHQPALVIIDPLFAFTGAKTDIHRANECRAISAPLSAIAERQGCALLAVRHLGKSRGGGHALNAGIGSIDFAAAARSVLLVGADPDETNKRAVVQTKNNLAPHGEAIGYTLEGGQFYWTGASTLTATRILSLATDDVQRSALVDAIDFLRNALADGSREVEEVGKEARQVGITMTTLRRAREQLGIRARRIGQPGKKQQFFWSLNNDKAHQRPDDAQEMNDEHHRVNEVDKGSYSQHLADDAQAKEIERYREPNGHHRDVRPILSGVPQGGQAVDEGNLPF